MAGFDQDRVYTSAALHLNQDDEDMNDDRSSIIDVQSYTNTLKEFIREYKIGRESGFKYRDLLKQNYNNQNYSLEVTLDDISNFNEVLVSQFLSNPSQILQIFEDAAKEVADEVTSPRPEGMEEVKDIQVMIVSDSDPTPLRNITSSEISKFVIVSGIVLTAHGIRSKAVKVSLMCRGCKSVLPNIIVKTGLEGVALPRKCAANQGPQAAGGMPCPLDPYFILSDKCNCVDFQTLKLQETPESVPSGEMPRHIQLYCDRFLCEKAVPGNRVTICGIYSIKKATEPTKKNQTSKVSSGVRFPYIRVLGISVHSEAGGRVGRQAFTVEEVTKFTALARDKDCYEKISKSIAPSIFGFEDIKRAIACLLFAGSRKRLPDGLSRRGDINVLLLGDPGTAKSQLLKFVEKVSPIAVYTSGKGSSAAGLTASINRDPSTRNFVMEGGAMVLADGGIVCIDEFDKMREDDRVAIHEAMEQQTISIAKAGITTTLNSRCAVLAAANSVFGRWDETKGDENIDFMPTIISRFDAIFVVKDEHGEERDNRMAKHVMKVHINAQKTGEVPEVEGELSLEFLKKYVSYCRQTCGPRLSAEAAEKLNSRYVGLRSEVRTLENEHDRRNKICITVRQLEAIIRMAEALAKMQLKPFATEVHVDEAIRLFHVSTLEAANAGNLSGVEGFTTQEDQDILNRIENQMKKRFAIGSQVSEKTIIQDFTRQKYPERAIFKVIQALIRRGELQHRLQRKMLLRVK